MSNDNKLAEVERLAREFHAVYTEELKRQGAENRHSENYDDLSEPIKDIDRALARYVSRLLDAATHEARYKSSNSSHGCYFCGKQGRGKDRHLILLCDEHRDIRRLIDAAHADALRAAVELLRCKCGMDCGYMDCTVRPNDILALVPERARLERELEVARAVLMAQETMNDLIQGGRDFGIKGEAGNHVVESRRHVADLEAKLAALEGK